MKTDRVKYYYKDLDTGVEVTFTKTSQWGWAVQFHVSKQKMVDIDTLMSEIKLPWPELSEEEQNVVNANYKALEERMK